MPRRKLTKEEFIERARAVHGDKYDYDKVEYNGDNIPVAIICPIHGEFPQKPCKHKLGQGCPECAKTQQIKSKTKSIEEFIAEAKSVHKNNYSYDSVVYKNTDTPVFITCPIHGNFPQKPYKHLQGQGCPYCAGNKKKTTEQIIEEFKLIHGHTYDYSLVVYNGDKKKVKIICPKHGEFEQTPHEHKNGRGCYKCKISHMENAIVRLLEENNIEYDYESHINDILELKSADFYLPQYNIAIECQGGQHFYNSFGSSEETRAKTHQSVLKRDIEKYNILLKNNVKLLYYTTNNICPKDVFSNEKYKGIYTHDNLIIENKELLLTKIKGEL